MLREWYIRVEYNSNYSNVMLVSVPIQVKKQSDYQYLLSAVMCECERMCDLAWQKNVKNTSIFAGLTIIGPTSHLFYFLIIFCIKSMLTMGLQC